MACTAVESRQGVSCGELFFSNNNLWVGTLNTIGRRRERWGEGKLGFSSSFSSSSSFSFSPFRPSVPRSVWVNCRKAETLETATVNAVFTKAQ